MLLPRIVAHTSNVDLVLLVLWRIAPEMANHSPPSQVEQILFAIAHIKQLLLDHLLLELAEISVRASHGAGVLDGRVQVHPILPSLV